MSWVRTEADGFRHYYAPSGWRLRLWPHPAIPTDAVEDVVGAADIQPFENAPVSHYSACTTKYKGVAEIDEALIVEATRHLAAAGLDPVAEGQEAIESYRAWRTETVAKA